VLENFYEHEKQRLSDNAQEIERKEMQESDKKE